MNTEEKNGGAASGPRNGLSPITKAPETPRPILTLRASRKQNVHKALGEMWESPICVGDGNCVAIVYGGNAGGTSSSREAVEAFAGALIAAYNSYDSLARELEQAKGLLAQAEQLPELNPSNYDHEDVCDLNARVTEFVLAIRAALKVKPSNEVGT